MAWNQKYGFRKTDQIRKLFPFFLVPFYKVTIFGQMPIPYICSMRTQYLPLLFILFTQAGYHSHDIKKIQINGTAQGTTYHISYYASDTIVTKDQIDSILNKIDSSLSLYKPYSLINKFNHSPKGITGDAHFNKVVKKALEIHKKTGGLFDITIYPLTDAWGFGVKRKDTVPTAAAIKNILGCVDSRLLYWRGSELIKRKSCVQLDANGIAQGYSVDVVAGFFEGRGVHDYVVELGGEIRVKGRKPGNEKMSVGIEAPGEDAEFSLIEKIIYPDNGAITTSGNYRRYYNSGGKQVSHLLDPRTGYSVQNELISVTVYAKDAITADGYDNAIMAMGLKDGLDFVDKNKTIAAHFIYRKSDGTIADTASKRFSMLLQH